MSPATSQAHHTREKVDFANSLSLIFMPRSELSGSRDERKGLLMHIAALMFLFRSIQDICHSQSDLSNTIYSHLKYSIVHIVDVNTDLIYLGQTCISISNISISM